MSSDGKMLCLTIYSYKKAGLSDDEYRSYMLKTHAPLASTLMEKYGIVDFTMVRTYPRHCEVKLSGFCWKSWVCSPSSHGSVYSLSRPTGEHVSNLLLVSVRMSISIYRAIRRRGARRGF